MALTELTWEEVKNYNKASSKNNVYKNNGQYYFVTEEGGIAPQIVVYKLSEEDYQFLEKGKRSAAEIHFKLQNDAWPPTENEKKEANRNFIRETPTALISDPSSQGLFSHEELKKLIPIAEKQWIDWKGKLPDNYVSPIKNGE
ncbi:hypothetical protein [Lactovum odontotermitis]